MKKKELIKQIKYVDNETEIDYWILDNLFSRKELIHYLNELRVGE